MALRWIARAVVIVLLLVTWSGCGSSSSSLVTTEPTPVKCSVTASVSPSTFSSSGGTGNATVTTARECTWSASSDASWIVITSGSTGQGDGVVGYRVAANSAPASRTGGITINGDRMQVRQDGASCEFSLDRTGVTVGPGGGSETISVTTIAGCAWTAVSQVPWVTVSADAGATGSGKVSFEVAANVGPTRTGTLLVAGQTFTVTQEQASAMLPPAPPNPSCTYSIAPNAQTIGAVGGPLAVSVSTGAGCLWAASSSVSWITVVSATGSGSGSVQLTVAANPTSSIRTGTVTIADKTFTLQQSGSTQSCSYSISPTSASAAAAGASENVNVTTAASCQWVAVSNTSWITITSGAAGSGNGTVRVTAAANTGTSSRSGTATIAGQTFTFQQAAAAAPPACTYEINPTAVNVPVKGDNDLRVAVTTTATCAWTAASNVAWISVKAGSSGTGNGEVRLDVESKPPLPLGARTGTATIAGRTFTVTQP
jgi:hypothetical protein